MSFSQGLSGLNAAARALDTVGNNIANSQTYGFKAGSAAFADIFAGTQGMGVQAVATTQNFNDGGLTSTGRSLDMGIGGEGFFRLVDRAGQAWYSRNGQFDADVNGYITNLTNGLQLTGYQASGTPPSIKPGAAIGPIRIDKSAMPPSASASGKLQGNLNSGDAAIPATPGFDPQDAETYNFASQLEAYDSLGNRHDIDIYYVKSAAGQWTAYANDATAPVTDASGKPVCSKLDLTFNENGECVRPAPPATLQLNVKSAAFNGAAALDLNLDLGNLTQHAADASTAEVQNIDGHRAGDFLNFQISDRGEIVANYNNGQKQTIAQVALASFASVGGLEQNGDNTWRASAQSGAAVLGTPGSGKVGRLTGGALENANVDLGNEMVNMIIYQRNYQSNSQTIKTQSEMLQTLVNLR